MANAVTRSDERNNDTLTLSLTGRIARWSARRRWWVVAASVVVIALAIFVLSTVETKLLDGNSGGVGDSQQGANLIDERFKVERAPTDEGEKKGPTQILVVSHPSLTVEDQEFRSKVEHLVQELRALPEVKSAASYYDTQSPEMASKDGRAVLAQVVIEAGNTHDNTDAALATVRAAREEGGDFRIAMTGNVNDQIEEIVNEDFARIMMVTVVLGLGILLVAFRAVVAAVIPLILAIGAIFSATAIAAIVSQTYPLASEYSEMILLMGMAVGIDYSLFIVSRFRAERKAGRPKLEAIAVASNTTGRAVFYAGITVVVSLAGLMLTNNPIFISMAIAAIIVVLIAIVGSLTLLPAILSVLGDNVNRLRLPFLRNGSNGGGVWGTIADKVLARPAIFAAVTAAALIALAAPAATLNLGFNQSATSLPDAVEAKQAYLLLEEHFTLGLTDPAEVVFDGEFSGEGRFLKVSVSSIEDDREVTSQLYQLSKTGPPQNEFHGGHGFTGLSYAYHPTSPSELQYWCVGG